MSSYFDKLSEYYNSDKAAKDTNRFLRQVRNTYISTAVILGAVILLIIVILAFSALNSIYRLTI